jgi:hypothetical protein
MDPWRVGHQSDRNMTVCACVCRFGAANGPCHILLCVLRGQWAPIVLVIDCHLQHSVSTQPTNERERERGGESARVLGHGARDRCETVGTLVPVRYIS